MFFRIDSTFDSTLFNLKNICFTAMEKVSSKICNLGQFYMTSKYGICWQFSILKIGLRTKINFFCVCCRRNHCIFYGSLHILSILYPVVGSILYYSNHISDKNFHKNCSECILSILIDFATWLWYFWKTNHLLKLFPSKLKHYISFSSTSAATITTTYTPLS